MFLKMPIQKREIRTYVAKMFGSRKPAEAKVHAEAILALEIEMSNPDLTVERRDRRKSYNPMTIAELQN
jgi:endothelin-converting enzyme/putative endopeptidase